MFISDTELYDLVNILQGKMSFWPYNAPVNMCDGSTQFF